jgi:CheY-like chemotaxis protein
MQSVLVVSRRPTIRRALSYMLRRDGYTVVTVTDDRQALGLMAERAVDLIIADMSASPMGGLDLLRHLRSAGGSAHLPVIVLSDSGHNHDSLRAERAGASAVLSWPVASAELSQAVAYLLAPRSVVELPPRRVVLVPARARAVGESAS